MWPLLTGSGNSKTVPPPVLLPEIVIDRSPATARLPSQVTVSVFALEEPPQPVRKAGKIRRAPSNRRLGILGHFLLEARPRPTAACRIRKQSMGRWIMSPTWRLYGPTLQSDTDSDLTCWLFWNVVRIDHPSVPENLNSERIHAFVNQGLSHSLDP